MNLNEDSMLSGHIKYEFKEGTSNLGRAQTNDVAINGLGIGQEHCQIQRRDHTHTIIPSRDAANKTMINGVLLT